MQLEPEPAPADCIRDRLRLAACLLIASGAPSSGQAADATPTYQLDVTSLYYKETDRVSVVEPTGRLTWNAAPGRSFYVQFGVDAITGASPSGASPNGQPQTVTSASGHVSTRAGNEIPVTSFRDQRFALDGGWVQTFGRYTSTLTTHFSRERDYASIGAGAKLSVDLFQRSTTLTFGAGFNQDDVFPKNGITGGLVDPNLPSIGTSKPKSVAGWLFGVTQVLSRRWLLSATATRTGESGYLTEPYKIVSIIDGATGFSTGGLTEQRPDTRTRTSLLLSSVYQPRENVLSTSYRYYWDDWGVRAHTLDLRYRHDYTENVWVEPHVRWYRQSGADFFTPQLVAGDPLPSFATSDVRLGPMRTGTLGATLGFRLSPENGEWRVRLEYLGIAGEHHPAGAVGVQRGFDLYPTLNTYTLLVDYSLKF